jgi:hypothetical protein
MRKKSLVNIFKVQNGVAHKPVQNLHFVSINYDVGIGRGSDTFLKVYGDVPWLFLQQSLKPFPGRFHPDTSPDENGNAIDLVHENRYNVYLKWYRGFISLRLHPKFFHYSPVADLLF